MNCPYCNSPVLLNDFAGNPWYHCGTTKTFRSASCVDREPLATELRNALDRIKRLEEAVDAYRTAYTPDGHVSPHDCFATGPKTGNPFQDLFACPGCWAERKAKEAKL